MAALLIEHLHCGTFSISKMLSLSCKVDVDRCRHACMVADIDIGMAERKTVHAAGIPDSINKFG